MQVLPLQREGQTGAGKQRRIKGGQGLLSARVPAKNGAVIQPHKTEQEH